MQKLLIVFGFCITSWPKPGKMNENALPAEMNENAVLKIRKCKVIVQITYTVYEPLAVCGELDGIYHMFGLEQSNCPSPCGIQVFGFLVFFFLNPVQL